MITLRCLVGFSVLLLANSLPLFAQQNATLCLGSSILQKSSDASGFALVADGTAAPFWYDQADFAGVIRAIGDLQLDIGRVTDRQPELLVEAPKLRRPVIIGTVGKNPVIDALISAGEGRARLLRRARRPNPLGLARRRSRLELRPRPAHRRPHQRPAPLRGGRQPRPRTPHLHHHPARGLVQSLPLRRHDPFRRKSLRPHRLGKSPPRPRHRHARPLRRRHKLLHPRPHPQRVARRRRLRGEPRRGRHRGRRLRARERGPRRALDHRAQSRSHRLRHHDHPVHRPLARPGPGVATA